MGWVAVGGHALQPGGKGTAVDRPTESVEHASEQAGADLDRGRPSRGDDGGADTQTVQGAIGHTGQRVVLEGDDLGMNRSLRSLDGQGIADGGLDAGHFEVQAEHTYDSSYSQRSCSKDGLRKALGGDHRPSPTPGSSSMA